MEALDDLALALRERLIERARSGEGGAALETEVKAVRSNWAVTEEKLAECESSR